MKKTKKVYLPTRQGSVLAYSLIILGMMLAIAASLSAVSIIEKKSASATEFSVQSLQTADSGAQLALKKIKAAPTQEINDIFSPSTCSGSGVFSDVTDAGKGTYTLSFFTDEAGTASATCNALASSIKNIKSVGTYNGTVRAVSVVVAVDACGGVTTISKNLKTYGTVVAKDGRCWLDRNLGFPSVATASDDHHDDDWFFQWGRLVDGHQIIDSTSKNEPSMSDTPGHNEFIKLSDWRSPRNNTLWQGVLGINNPCPTGFRLPTHDEWAILKTSENITTSASAFASTLKLVIMSDGLRGLSGNFLDLYDAFGMYWSSSINGASAFAFAFAFSDVATDVTDEYSLNRGIGIPVRCIKN